MSMGPIIPEQQAAYVLYDTTTGVIIGGGSGSYVSVFNQLRPGMMMGAGGIDTHYVDLSTKLLKRKAKGAAVLKGMSLTNLPKPCTLEVRLIDDVLGDLPDQTTVYTVTDGVADLTISYPGRYAFIIRSMTVMTQRIEMKVPPT